MIVRSLDQDHDWTFGKGKNNYKAGILAQEQNIDTRLNSFLGDCFFATADGVDWFNLLGAKDQLKVQLAVSAILLNTQNVKSILDISVTLDKDRRMVLSYEVQSNFGTISVTNTQLGGLLVTESGDVITTEDGEGIET